MKTLFIDCGMGAAGDMLTAALAELLPDRNEFFEKLNSLGIPGVKTEIAPAVKCGITGSSVRVTVDGVEESEEMHEHHHDHAHHDHGHDDHHHDSHEHDHDHEHDEHHHDSHSHDHHEHDHEHDHDHEHPHDCHEHNHEHDHAHHHHSSMHSIGHIIDGLNVPGNVKEDIRSVYRLIAEAESAVHGVPVTEIHFHEVGTMDAVADITAVCLLINELAPDEIIVSPVNTGGGKVKCAHGILPVPAPATAHILKDVPIYDSGIKGELCTPTGAALLKHFATKFGQMPVMTVNSIGYGMGKKDFPVANCIRVMLGESTDLSEKVPELSCNVDDMTAEEIAFATERLFEGGALEVYTIPVGMKKSRPGTLIRVMCRARDKEEIIRLMFKYTTTIGIRETETKRYVLDRKIEKVYTDYGEVRRKTSAGYGVKRVKYEYEDLARIACERGISIDDVKKELPK